MKTPKFIPIKIDNIMSSINALNAGGYLAKVLAKEEPKDTPKKVLKGIEGVMEEIHNRTKVK
jgi:pimeloyl-CoA synthetase